MINYSEKCAGDRSLPLAASALAVIKAVVGSFIFLIITFTVLALVYTYSDMSESLLETCVSALGIISLVLSGFLSSQQTNSFGWLHGAAAGLLHTILRICLGLIIFKGYIPSEPLAKMLAAGILFAMAGGIAGVNKPRINKKKRK